MHRPNGISSRAHYQPCVISLALTEPGERRDREHRHGGSGDRLRAEHRPPLGVRVAALAEPAVLAGALVEPALLASALVEEASEPVLGAMAVELAAPQRLRALPLRAPTVIALLETLASLRGSAPPALAHAPTLIPADAPSL